MDRLALGPVNGTGGIYIASGYLVVPHMYVHIFR